MRRRRRFTEEEMARECARVLGNVLATWTRCLHDTLHEIIPGPLHHDIAERFSQRLEATDCPAQPLPKAKGRA